MATVGEQLQADGKAQLTMVEPDAYIDMEMAMSICALSDIKEYWCGKMFLGQRDFTDTMSPDRFLDFRSALQVHRTDDASPAQPALEPVAQLAAELASSIPHPPAESPAESAASTPEPATPRSTPEADTSSPDSLWHSRPMLHHFQRKFASIAVPTGVCTLGTVRVNLIDKWNKEAVSESVERVQQADRGYWELVAAVDAPPGANKSKAVHDRAQAKLLAHERTAFVTTLRFSSNAGYLIFKEKSVVAMGLT
ncbi:unnamed protein product [Phytophthora fragariaefolia]|uniref:Unnamed protein product n=1 Tax=Phytophthora fragariaefolia TaxID=1490495 RepID=A0A9W6XX71_9STRA|nr:unnamed protein product [Phytophthora fragariaefolia]